MIFFPPGWKWFKGILKFGFNKWPSLGLVAMRLEENCLHAFQPFPVSNNQEQAQASPPPPAPAQDVLTPVTPFLHDNLIPSHFLPIPATFIYLYLFTTKLGESSLQVRKSGWEQGGESQSVPRMWLQREEVVTGRMRGRPLVNTAQLGLLTPALGGQFRVCSDLESLVNTCFGFSPAASLLPKSEQGGESWKWDLRLV